MNSPLTSLADPHGLLREAAGLELQLRQLYQTRETLLDARLMKTLKQIERCRTGPLTLEFPTTAAHLPRLCVTISADKPWRRPIPESKHQWPKGTTLLLNVAHRDQDSEPDGHVMVVRLLGTLDLVWCWREWNFPAKERLWELSPEQIARTLLLEHIIPPPP